MALRAPAQLHPNARRAWRCAIASLEADSAELEGAWPVLIAFAEAVDIAERARDEWLRLGCPMVRVGEGPEREHVLIGILRSQHGKIGELSERLRLDPKARRGFAPGWTLGKARSPDRQYRPPGPERKPTTGRRATVVAMRPPAAVQRILDDADAR